MRRPRLPEIHVRQWLMLHWLHLLGALVLIVIFLNFGSALKAERDRGEVSEQLDQSQVRTAALAEAVDALIHQVKEAGEQPYIESSKDVVENIPLPKGESGPQGAMGPPGQQGPPPSETQVRMAVEAYLFLNPPEPGRPPTLEEIQGAVNFFCSRFSQCVGPEGEEGEQGERGVQGVPGAVGPQGQRGPVGATGIPGPQGTPGIQGLQGLQGQQGPVGPAPTQVQINAAVAAFCAANNGCKGPAGAEGKDGRGILSMTCASGPKINITVRFTDGTSTVLSC